MEIGILHWCFFFCSASDSFSSIRFCRNPTNVVLSFFLECLVLGNVPNPSDITLTKRMRCRSFVSVAFVSGTWQRSASVRHHGDRSAKYRRFGRGVRGEGEFIGESWQYRQVGTLSLLLGPTLSEMMAPFF